MIDLIKERLSKVSISGWQIRQTKRASYQLFLAKLDPECARRVDTTRFEVTLYQMRRAENGQDVLGLSSFRTGIVDVVTLDKLIEDALLAAMLVSNQPFDLPEAFARYPEVGVEESNINENILTTFHERLVSAISKEKFVRLSSAEFFADLIETRLVNHRGLDVTQRETVLHTEFIVLSRTDHKENEYISRYSRRLLKDFDLESEVRESSELSRNATVSITPKTGVYPVLMSGEPLDHLFSPVLAKASARLKYNKMLDVDVGKMITSPGLVSGDKISLWSRNLLPGALGSNRFDSYGTPGQDVKLIDHNKVVCLLADQRYGSYLNIPVTGELGNIEIEAGSTHLQKLIDDVLARHGQFIHLLAFSAFEPNPITGAYSAEIRAGFLVTRNGQTPIKGGSVSGVIQKDLLRCRLSSERSMRERILCPTGVLFDELSIAGE